MTLMSDGRSLECWNGVHDVCREVACQCACDQHRLPPFDGADYVPSRDDARLSGQLRRIFECMNDGQWRTLSQIATITGDPAPSISAQLRHLRKPRFGSYRVDRRHVGNGLYEYRVLDPVRT